MGKYDPLGDYLRGQSKTDFRLSFVEIETILRQRLPATASTPQFWSNVAGKNPLFHYARRRAWLENGYDAFYIREDATVRFVKR